MNVFTWITSIVSRRDATTPMQRSGTEPRKFHATSSVEGRGNAARKELSSPEPATTIPVTVDTFAHEGIFHYEKQYSYTYQPLVLTDEVFYWLRDNNIWYRAHGSTVANYIMEIEFRSEEDALLFKLTWMK